MNLATTFQDKTSEVQKKIMALGLGIAVTFGCAMNAQNAQADEAITTPGQQEVNFSKNELNEGEFFQLQEAHRYAQSQKGVGIYVLKGTANEHGLTGEDIGAALVEAVNKHKAPAQAFVAQSRGQHTVVMYVVGDLNYKPTGPGVAAKNAETVAQDYIASTYVPKRDGG